ncbi:unnamed protein product [Allacma fusca]|uniref:Peptidase S8/S53 domain-containing protein n=1 Tax=Allacma fusca TaxID=39272 RepID=A0A8J2JI20_9HEXA|nr:unnamed protein product [Allacma fusca]
MKVQLLLAITGLLSTAVVDSATVEQQILKNLEETSSTNVLVTFKNSNSKAALSRFDSLVLASRDARLNTMYAILKDHADTVQADVIAMLEKSRSSKNTDIRQLWISAELIVRGADKETVEALRNHPDVESLVAETFIPLEPIEGNGNRGEGIVVANIDTGVRYTHVALKSNFRGTIQGNNNYAWYAPTGKAAIPSDSQGHGTHTMGTIAGTANGIGVAPGATWIACKGCAGSSCSNFDLTECGNWVACPTTTSGASPDCGKAPHIVSNSWGGGQGDSWYDNNIAAWRRINIVPLFSAGNSGPNCRTANSPSDRPGAIAVGSTTNGDVVSSFSSVGPTVDGRMKPDIAAPGSSIVSAASILTTTLEPGVSMPLLLPPTL